MPGFFLQVHLMMSDSNKNKRRKASSVRRPQGLSKTITSFVSEITGGSFGGSNFGNGSPTSSRLA